jgi:hypothetical protein
LVSLLVHALAATTFTTIRTTEPFFVATGILYAIVVLLPKEETSEEMPKVLEPVRLCGRKPQAATGNR